MRREYSVASPLWLATKKKVRAITVPLIFLGGVLTGVERVTRVRAGVDAVLGVDVSLKRGILVHVFE